MTRLGPLIGPECAPHRQLVPPALETNEKEIGNVRDSDEQYESDTAKQDPQVLCQPTDDCIFERRHACSKTVAFEERCGIRVGKTLRQTIGQIREFGFRILGKRGVRQPRDQWENMVVAEVPVRIDALRDPNVPRRTWGCVRNPHAGFEYANDLEECTVDVEGSADNSRIAPELATPKPVRQHGDVRCARLVVLCANHVPQVRTGAEQRENAGGYTPPVRAERPFRRAADSLARPPWARLAYEFGYADQAHLINESRALVGHTPAMIHRARRAENDALANVDGD